ncbi:fasciclin domain-containing protein [Muriicola sp.]|uniref:fasciclin domain-containing protein n=1 Tax=Muriicola sp. TaxID=2020856 RepID=UPI003C719619
MKKFLKFKPMFILMALTFIFTSCSDDDNDAPPPPPLGNIVEVALEDVQLTALVAALERTGLTSALEADGPLTVLAPTNAAFTAFLNGASIEDVPVDDLAAILLNHVIVGEFEAADLINLGAGYVPSSSPNAQGLNVSIYFNTSNGVRFNNTGAVIDNGADISASNGVIHKIDAVLDLPDIADHAIANPELSTLVTALGLADLVGAVQGPGPLTVLAPDNAAFEEFLGDTDPTTILPLLTNTLLNHVLAGSITSSMLVEMEEGYTTSSATNADEDAISLYFNTTSGVEFNGVSTVTAADIIATNGVIHAVDAVVGLPTIATFATANPALSGLVAAIQRADEGDNVINWLPAISNPDLLFTVFAPADPAFDVLLEDLGANNLGEVDPAAVNGLLTLHVVNDANVRSTDLGDLGGVIPTIGGNLSLNGLVITDGDGNDINILAPSLVDIQAINGVVHAVDYVIRAAVN